MSAPAPEPRADGSSFERIVDALGGLALDINTHARRARAQCPAHDDHNPSLSVDWSVHSDKGGHTLLHCFGGCDADAVLAALELGWTDKYDTPPRGRGAAQQEGAQRPRRQARSTRPATRTSNRRKPLPPLVEEYLYSDRDGVIVAKQCRYEGKEFRWWHPDESKPTGWALGQPKGQPVPLYNLPLVAATAEGAGEVHLVEGEKDANALVASGQVATSLPNGAAKIGANSTLKNLPAAELEVLRGAHVIIWADRDGADKKNPARGYTGYRHALFLRMLLQDVAASVAIVQAAAGKDASDHLAAGYAVADATAVEPLDVVPASVLNRWSEASMPATAPDADGGEFEGDDNVIHPEQFQRRGSGGGGGTGNGGSGGSESEDDPEEVYVRTHYERYEHPEYGPVIVQKRHDKANNRIVRKEIWNADVRVTKQIVREVAGEELDSWVDLQITQLVDGERRTHEIKSLARKEFEDPTKWAGRVPLPLEFPRTSGKGKAIEAIMQTSGPIEVETCYGALGWAEVSEGQWAYVHADGAIDANGTRPGVRVEVSPRLRGFTLPDPPTGTDLRAAYDSIMSLADHLPHRVAYPMIAAGCRAVLGECTASVFLLGRTATYKSGLAALIQQMIYPAARYDRLPAGAGEAAATPGALEQMMHEAGTFLVLDDLAPDRGSARSAARAAELLRSIGNRTSKARLERETAKGLRADKPIRSMVMLTGEDQPTVQSAERRTIYVQLRRGDVPFQGLLALSDPEQIKARSGVTAALAQWVAAKMPTDAWLEEQRNHWAGWLAAGYGSDDGTVTGRCNTVAELVTGIRALLDLVVEHGVVSREEAAERWHQAWGAIREVLADQFNITEGRSLTDRAAELLRSALRAGRAHLCSDEGGVPERAQLFGWTCQGVESRAHGDQVGWTDGAQMVRLQPGAAWRVLLAEGKAQDDELAVTRRAMQKDLVESGLMPTDPPEKPGGAPRNPRRTVGGTQERVWELPMSWLYPEDNEDGDGDDEGGDGGSGPEWDPTSPPLPFGDQASPAQEQTQTSATKPADSVEPQNSTKKPTETRQPVKTGRSARQSWQYRAAGVVCDVDGAYLVRGVGTAESATVAMPEVGSLAELLNWAVTLNLGVHHTGTREQRAAGLRDDAGLIVIMPKLAKQLGIPAKAPNSEKRTPTVKRAEKALEEAGWMLGKRGLAAYTQVWQRKQDGRTGRSHFAVFPEWSTEPIFEGVTEAAMLAYRMDLFTNSLGHQLVYNGGATGISLLRSARARGDENQRLTTEVSERDVPPPALKTVAEDAEWGWWRPLTEDEQQCTHVVGLDINAAYLAAAATATVGLGAWDHLTGPQLTTDALRRPGYVLTAPLPGSSPVHELAPDLLNMHGLGRASEPVPMTTVTYAALLEAGEQPVPQEAWIYRQGGKLMQTWAHTIRDAIYPLKNDPSAVGDEDVEKALTELKLTYAAGLGQLASRKWREGSPMWLPQFNHTVKGTAQVGLWRKVVKTGQATGRWPVGMYRDTVYYATNSVEFSPDVMPLQTAENGIKGGFIYDQDRYVMGHCKPAEWATRDAYAAAEAITDRNRRYETLADLWTKYGTEGTERSE